MRFCEGGVEEGVECESIGLLGCTDRFEQMGCAGRGGLVLQVR